MEKMTKMFLFGFLFATLLSNNLAAQQNFQILDRFGSQYTVEDIELPIQRPRGECNLTFDNIIFEVDYEDFGTGLGFDDPVNGESRRNVLCQVLTDVSHFVKATNNYCTGEKPTVRIQILPSLNQIPTGAFENNTFSLGSPYY